MKIKPNDPLIRESLHETPQYQEAMTRFLELWTGVGGALGVDPMAVDRSLWGDIPQEVRAELNQISETLEDLAHEILVFWRAVTQGAVFRHKRYITTDREPEVCRITNVKYCRHGVPDMIFYRVGVSDDRPGLSTKSAPEYFIREVWGSWVQT